MSLDPSSEQQYTKWKIMEQHQPNTILISCLEISQPGWQYKFKTYTQLVATYLWETISPPVRSSNPQVGNGNPLQCSCMENPMDCVGLQSMGLQRVGHNLATNQQQKKQREDFCATCPLPVGRYFQSHPFTLSV